jgi:DNA polymerase-3 subunit epsilon
MSGLLDWIARRAQPADDRRWVVLDVESSGLDPRRDRLLAIAAIGVHFDNAGPRIHLGDSFEAVLHQAGHAAPTDKANILLHGIGVSAQRGGIELKVALQAYAAFVGQAPLAAFHAAFDRMLIERAFAAAGIERLRNPWLDLEPVAAVLHPAVKARALDEWLAHFDIHCSARHQAAADTLATAELLLKLWPAACRQMARPGFKAAAALAAQRRWLQGR